MELHGFNRHCGSRIISDFWTTYLEDTVPSHVKTLFGIFIDHPDQRRSYEKLKKKFKILYQSPILKRNPSTGGNPYFIVIWLNEKP